MFEVGQKYSLTVLEPEDFGDSEGLRQTNYPNMVVKESDNFPLIVFERRGEEYIYNTVSPMFVKSKLDDN